MTAAIVALKGVEKNYGALRPLRVQALEIARGERVAVSGFDAAASEMLVNLVTGATLPDAGTVTTFGRITADISNSDEWIASLDKFGIVSPRAVLLEGSTLQQNLALPFTLSIDEIPAADLERIAILAAESGLSSSDLDKPVAALPPHVRMRAHVARAIGMHPELLLIEHPTTEVAEDQRIPLARDIAAVAERRGTAALIVTTDVEFAETVAHRSLALQPATGAMVPWKRKRGWFS